MFEDLIGQSHTQVGKCFGLARIVCARMGTNLPPWPGICIEQAKTAIESRMQFFTPVADPQPADLVHVRSMDHKHHVAVVIGNGHMIQSTKKHGVHIMRLDHPWVVNRILGFYRYAA